MKGLPHLSSEISTNGAESRFCFQTGLYHLHPAFTWFTKRLKEAKEHKKVMYDKYIIILLTADFRLQEGQMRGFHVRFGFGKKSIQNIKLHDVCLKWRHSIYIWSDVNKAK